MENLNKILNKIALGAADDTPKPSWATQVCMYLNNACQPEGVPEYESEFNDCKKGAEQDSHNPNYYYYLLCDCEKDRDYGRCRDKTRIYECMMDKLYDDGFLERLRDYFEELENVDPRDILSVCAPSGVEEGAGCDWGEPEPAICKYDEIFDTCWGGTPQTQEEKNFCCLNLPKVVDDYNKRVIYPEIREYLRECRNHGEDSNNPPDVTTPCECCNRAKEAIRRICDDQKRLCDKLKDTCDPDYYRRTYKTRCDRWDEICSRCSGQTLDMPYCANQLKGIMPRYYLEQCIECNNPGGGGGGGGTPKPGGRPGGGGTSPGRRKPRNDMGDTL